MINFLKKYSLPIILLAVLAGLILYLVPHEEKHYLKPEIDAVKKLAHSIAIWAAVILFVLLFLFRLKQINSTKDFFSSFPVFVVLAVAFYFLVETFVLPSTLLVNRLSASDKVEKNYSVMYIDTTHHTVLLWDAEEQESLPANQLFPTVKKRKIENRQAITVAFGKGLLGFNVDPAIK